MDEKVTLTSTANEANISPVHEPLAYHLDALQLGELLFHELHHPSFLSSSSGVTQLGEKCLPVEEKDWVLNEHTIGESLVRFYLVYIQTQLLDRFHRELVLCFATIGVNLVNDELQN